MSAVPGPRRPVGASDGTAADAPVTSTGPAAPSDAVGGGVGAAGSADVPAQRTAADMYRVSEEQVHRARMAVARNAVDSDDCRCLLDMLGLIGEPGEPPPVRR